MDFQYIVLNRAEFKRLQKLSKQPSGLHSDAKDEGLINNRLATRSHYGSNSPDACCPPSVITHITDEGRKYLIYKKLRQKEWLWSNAFTLVNTFLALIAAIASIIALLQ